MTQVAQTGGLALEKYKGHMLDLSFLLSWLYLAHRQGWKEFSSMDYLICYHDSTGNQLFCSKCYFKKHNMYDKHNIPIMKRYWDFTFPSTNYFIFPSWNLKKKKNPYLSTQSERREQWLEAGASWPPTAYKNPLYVATPTPPLLLDIDAHMLHLFVCGSKHSIDFKQELPSLPPTAYSLG